MTSPTETPLGPGRRRCFLAPVRYRAKNVSDRTITWFPARSFGSIDPRFLVALTVVRSANPRLSKDVDPFPLRDPVDRDDDLAARRGVDRLAPPVAVPGPSADQ